MQPPDPIHTARLTLCKPLPEDAPTIFATWTQDPEVTRHMTWHPHRELDESRAALRRMIDAWERGTRFPYMILAQGTQQPLGMIELRPEGHKAELGYILARKFWNQGYMTEAASALRDWAFSQPGFFRLYATTSVENVASQRVMEKIGMTREGLLRRYTIHPNISAEPVDSYLYAIVRD